MPTFSSELLFEFEGLLPCIAIISINIRIPFPRPAVDGHDFGVVEIDGEEEKPGPS